MTANEIITELRSIGLDPAGLNLELINENRAHELMTALSALQSTEEAARDYLWAMQEAMNKADGPF